MNRQDLTLLTDFYELTMMQGYYEEKQNETVIFDVFLPPESLRQRIFCMCRIRAGDRLCEEPEFYLRGCGLLKKSAHFQ